MAKYLARLGWKVTVVTPDGDGESCGRDRAVADDDCRRDGIRRVPAGRRVSRPARTPLQAPGLWIRYLQWWAVGRVLRRIHVGLDECWLPSCLAAVRRFQAGEFDVVLATGSPFSTFVAARRAARRLRIPYVLDYRDPWSMNICLPRWSSRLVRPLERLIAVEAAATVMVSPSLARGHQETFGLSSPPAVVTNGYDPESLADVRPTVFDDFAVVYGGSFYTGQREIGPLVKAIRRAADLADSGTPAIRLHYYGGDGAHVMESAREHGAGGLVSCHGRVPRAQLLSATKGAGVAAVIVSIHDQSGSAERGIITGKLFEPLGLGTPVLLVAPEDGDAVALVEQAGAGRCFRASQTAAMAAWLVELARGRSGVPYAPPEACSWPALANRLDVALTAVLDGVAGDPRWSAGSVS